MYTALLPVNTTLELEEEPTIAPHMDREKEIRDHLVKLFPLFGEAIADAICLKVDERYMEIQVS